MEMKEINCQVLQCNPKAGKLIFVYETRSKSCPDFLFAPCKRKEELCPPCSAWRAHESESHTRCRRSGPEGCRKDKEARQRSPTRAGFQPGTQCMLTHTHARSLEQAECPGNGCSVGNALAAVAVSAVCGVGCSVCSSELLKVGKASRSCSYLCACKYP